METADHVNIRIASGDRSAQSKPFRWSLRTLLLLLLLAAAILHAAPARAQDGACCLTAGCVETTASGCQRLAGTFLGAGVPCDPYPCDPICTLEPSVLDFGRITLGSSRTLDFIVRNTGYVRAVGSFSEQCNGFQILSSASYDLLPGEAKTITVRFLPTVLGGHECQIQGSNCDGPFLLGEGSSGAPACTVTPTDLDFGALGVGQFRDRTITIENSGDGLLAGSASGCGPFSIVSGGTWELGPGEEQALVVRFRPTVVGPVSCTLETSSECADVIVRGSGEPTPSCLVAPADLQFGEVILDAQRDLTFTLENTGAGTLSGNVRVDCEAFVLVGTSGYVLEAGESQTFTVRFLPETEGLWECEIELGNACGVLAAMGVGVRAPLCAFTPTFLDFGDVPLGTSATESFRLTNFGGAPLVGTFLADCSEFTVAGDPSYDLAAGEWRDFEVTYSPQALGGQVCRLRGDGCAEYLLRAVAVEGAECATSVDSVDWGTVAVGTTEARSFMLGNVGDAPLTGTMAIVPEGDSASIFRFAATGGDELGYSLGAGEELEVTVELVAAQMGAATAHIDLGSVGAPCPDLPLRGEVGTPPVCGLSTDILDFGAVVLGGRREAVVSLANLGGARLVGAVTLDCPGFELVDAVAAAPADASADRTTAPPTTLPYDLGAGETLDVLLRFAPAAEGKYACVASFGDLCGSVTLTGWAERAPACALSATELDYGTVDLGAFADRTVLVENVGGGVLVGTVTSPCPSFFFVGGADYVLGPGESREIIVRFVPDRSGPISCALDFGAGCAAVTATASGNGPICVVSPSVLRFGTVLPGTSRELSFVVSNAGGGTLRGNASSACADFSLVGPADYELRAGESAVLSVRFAPATFGNATCEIDLSGGCAGPEANGSGGEPPLCSLDVDRLDFGSVALGDVVRRSFAIRNLGEGRLRGRVTANCAGFRVLGERNYDLGSNEIRQFEIELTAFEEGPRFCELDLGADCAQLEAMAEVRLPLGACCYADGSCSTTGEAACLLSGGIEWVDGVACATAACLPLGACCALDGQCFLATEEACFGEGGFSWSEGVGCTEVGCPPAGACCLDDGTCRIFIEAACAGDFGGAGSDCDPSPCVRLGACCFPDGSCTLGPEAECAPKGGISWSPGLTCEAVSCEPVGACCVASGTCLLTTEADCGGEYLGDATICTPQTCLAVGACCLDDGSCTVLREDLCRGTFLGDEAACTMGICAPKVEEVRVVRAEGGPAIEVVTPAGAVAELEGWYRAAGTFAYTQVADFTWHDGVWTAALDETSSSIRGIEYYLTYRDQALGLRVSHGNADTPNRIPIRGTAAVPWPRPGRLAMLAAPFTVEGAASVYAELADHLGPSGARTWKLGTWDPDEEAYVLVDPSHPEAFVSGFSWWLVLARAADAMELSGETYFPPDRSSTFPVRLQPGWNMIGNPAAYPLRTSPDRVFIADRGDVLTLADAASGSNPRVSSLYAYDPEDAGPAAPYVVAPLQLDVWEGAWIENRTGHAITLLLPAVDASSEDPPLPLAALRSWAAPDRGDGSSFPNEDILSGGDPAPAGSWLSATSAVAPAFAWSQSVDVRTAGEARMLLLATAEGAETGLDGRDLGDPPAAPGATLAAAFLTADADSLGRPRVRRLLHDVRPAGALAAWTLAIEAEAAVEIRFPEPIAEETDGRMRSESPSQMTAITATGSLLVRSGDDEPWRDARALASWILPAGSHQLSLVWTPPPGDPGDPGDDGDGDDSDGDGGNGGIDAAGPVSLRIEPHPIRGAASIFLTLTLPGAVQLDCHDARGARVSTQTTGMLAAGTHLLHWDARATDGGRLQAGTYFVRATTAAGSASRKVVLLPGR